MENRVAERRQELGLTQEDLAKRSRIGRQTVSDIESGAHKPSLETALLIAWELDKPMEALFWPEGKRRQF